MEEQEVPAVKHGHEHQEGQGQGPQEEEDLRTRSPASIGRRGAGISPPPLHPGTQSFWNQVDPVSDPCSAAA